jgi:hypothetical protein
VGVLRVVGTAGVSGRTGGRIRATVGERMLVHMIVPTMNAVKVAVVEIIDVVVVFDGRMSASGAVAMRMLIMRLVLAHCVILNEISVSTLIQIVTYISWFANARF